MSKKNRKPSPEIPPVVNAQEIPNYAIPTTDLEELLNTEPEEPQGEDCGEDCRD